VQPHAAEQQAQDDAASTQTQPVLVEQSAHWYSTTQGTERPHPHAQRSNSISDATNRGIWHTHLFIGKETFRSGSTAPSSGSARNGNTDGALPSPLRRRQHCVFRPLRCSRVLCSCRHVHSHTHTRTRVDSLDRCV
jgi:hypothetical protein